MEEEEESPQIKQARREMEENIRDFYDKKELDKRQKETKKLLEDTGTSLGKDRQDLGQRLAEVR